MTVWDWTKEEIGTAGELLNREQVDHPEEVMALVNMLRSLPELQALYALGIAKLSISSRLNMDELNELHHHTEVAVIMGISLGMLLPETRLEAAQI